MSHEHLAQGINWWAWDPHRSPMGWFLLDFVLFLALLAYFTGRPLRSALKERHHNMRRAVTQAAANHAKAISEQKLWAQKLAGLDGHLRELEQQNKLDGEAEAAQMLHDANERAQQARADAQLQSEQELRRAHERVRQQTMAEVLAMAERLVQGAVNRDDQDNLMAAAASSLPELPHRRKPSPRALGAQS